MYYDVGNSGGLGGQFNTVAKEAFGYDSSFMLSNNDIMNAFVGGGGPAHQPAPATPDVTKISNTNFHLPNVNTSSSQTVTAAGANITNTQNDKYQLDGTTYAYEKKDAQIKDVVGKTMKQEFGAGPTAKATAQLMPGSGVSKASVAGLLVDPTGLGDIYYFLSQIYAESKRMPNAKVNEMVNDTLVRLRQASQVAMHGDMNEARKLVPQDMNFDDINWTELKDFLERNPENDPIMRQAQEIYAALEQTEYENDIIRGHDHREGDMKEKAIYAAAGVVDEDGIKEVTDNSLEEFAVKVGIDVEEIPYTAGDTLFFASSLGDISGLEANGNDIGSLTNSDAEKALAAALANEPDPTKLAMSANMANVG